MTDAAHPAGQKSPDAIAGEKSRVAVIFGGVSSEHPVSCLTAAGVLGAINPQKYEVVGIGITRTGRWVRISNEAMANLTVVDRVLPELSEEASDAILIRDDKIIQLATRDEAMLDQLHPIDVAFSLLHGPFGEDGTIQGMFEMVGIPYVGTGVLASAVGMDKHFTKLVLAASGIPIGPFVVVTAAEWARDRAAALDAVASLHFPVFVKPARGGSSLGISKADTMDDLPAAIAAAQAHDPKVIVEQGVVDARELECGVLGGLAGGRPQASPVAEIRMHTESGFYDFEAKYLPEEQVDLDVPASLSPEISAAVQELAVRTFETIGCEGLARVDMFLTPEGGIVLNEINTMPGFTEHSMFPRMWASAGLDYPTLIDRLITLALQRPVGLR